MSENKDIEIKCQEPGCTEVRIHTAKDQDFYARKGYSVPKRCRTHSQARRAAHLARDEEQQQEKRDSWQGDHGYEEKPQSDKEMFGTEA